MKVVSACLAGVKCRYDRESKLNEKIVKLVKQAQCTLVCPEQLGGLPTPREPSEQKGSKVFTKHGKDVTENFARGAEEALKITKLANCKEAILKARSPSCGCGKVYDGTFSGKLIAGDGVFCALLKKNGVKCITEDELE